MKIKYSKNKTDRVSGEFNAKSYVCLAFFVQILKMFHQSCTASLSNIFRQSRKVTRVDMGGISIILLQEIDPCPANSQSFTEEILRRFHTHILNALQWHAINVAYNSAKILWWNLVDQSFIKGHDDQIWSELVGKFFEIA